MRTAIECDGEMLRELRENLRVTATEAAFHCEIQGATLSKFENGIGRLTPAQRQRLLRFLHSEAIRRHAQLGRLVQSWPSSQAGRTSVSA
jgi:transcriptional regulator with XRE-family HTH domain